MKYLLTCFVLAFVGLTFAQSCNKVNEVYSECGSACPETCANMNEQGRACIAVCKAGCFCKPGYVRNNKGDCVLKRDCPQTTYSQEVCADIDEVYNECGTACPETCANMNQKNRMCIDMCVKGCFCKPGYVRGSNLKCVPKSKCPHTYADEDQCADPNEQYKSCGTACPTTCKNFRIARSQMCPDVCKSGCFCKAPYVKDQSTGKCVLTKDCPQY